MDKICDIVLPLKRIWFAKIWNGEKDVEYRQKKPYWDKRIGSWVRNKNDEIHTILFQIGYANSGPRMLVDVYETDVGPCPYEGWGGRFYRLHFRNVRRFNRENCELKPIENFEKMNERKE